LVELYPQADIFSLVDFLNSEECNEIIMGKGVNTSFIQKLPFARTHFRNYLPLFPSAIESFDLKGYDLIISSSWAVAKGVRKLENQLHISYCHTPIRYAWDLYEEYTYNLPFLKKLLVGLSLKYIRAWDLKSLPRVNYFISNSDFVGERISKTYNRESTTIYPPVDTENFTLNETKEDFYLTASRLVPYKKTRLIVEAFNQMPEKRLVVIGDGEEYEAIKKIAASNIEMLGYQSKEVMIDYMQRAKGFVYAALEDFGIVPIEAMACGTPVVALGDGGTKETVIDGVTGVHFSEQTKESIIESISRFETIAFDYANISKIVQNYSTSRFKREVKEFIESKL
jgi:glycosyltransferase involved in cell wall biosynthesis